MNIFGHDKALALYSINLRHCKGRDKKETAARQGKTNETRSMTSFVRRQRIVVGKSNSPRYECEITKQEQKFKYMGDILTKRTENVASKSALE